MLKLNKDTLNEVNRMDRKFPIGVYHAPETVNNEHIKEWIDELMRLPNRLIHQVNHLTNIQLNTPYRENGWTVEQVVHHIADANMHSYIHFKLALTESNPEIKPYDESTWTTGSDEKHADIKVSLSLLQAIMGRWEPLLRSMVDSDFDRTFVHPQVGQKRLDQYLGFCVWHAEHHLAQIHSALD